jgi:hypothetical protein|tara:strand:+ start:527 stop:703 length:177 start_codon:yes stop_codon:yes gene_type:complete
MVTSKFNRRYGKPVQIGLPAEGALGNLLAGSVNNGSITAREAKAILRYKKMLSNKRKK